MCWILEQRLHVCRHFWRVLQTYVLDSDAMTVLRHCILRRRVLMRCVFRKSMQLDSTDGTHLDSDGDPLTPRTESKIYDGAQRSFEYARMCRTRSWPRSRVAWSTRVSSAYGSFPTESCIEYLYTRRTS